ncbi:MAG: N-formylglutamate amidohydrolase [Pseudomonadota bacterium]
MTDIPAFPLLGSTDLPPYQIVNETGAAHALLVCDHAGQAVPASLDRLGLSDEELSRHIAWDIGAAAVTRHLARMLDAPAVLANYSRLVIDPNRFPHDHAAAFPAVSDGTRVPGNEDLTESQRQARARSCFWPYHNAISRHLQSMREQRFLPAVIAIHSCTPVFQDEFRPWHVGVLWNQDPRLSLPLIDALRQVPGIEVGDNQPYSGRLPNFFTMAHHAESADLPHVALEVRQDLIGDAQGIRTWAEVLYRAFAPLIAGARQLDVAESARPGSSGANPIGEPTGH